MLSVITFFLSPFVPSFLLLSLFYLFLSPQFLLYIFKDGWTVILIVCFEKLAETFEICLWIICWFIYIHLKDAFIYIIHIYIHIWYLSSKKAFTMVYWNNYSQWSWFLILYIQWPQFGAPCSKICFHLTLDPLWCICISTY